MSVVTIDYHDLLNGTDLSEAIEKAYGSEPECLGVLTVKNVPDLLQKRQALLPLALALSKIPAEKLKEYEHPVSDYMFGWSHGKEVLQDGKPDLYKGSFYANPQIDRPTEDPKLMEAYPEYCSPNIWPAEIPELEKAFKDLGTLIVNVGALIAKHCDQYVEKRCPSYGKGKLQRIIETSPACKARLLHYFPPSPGIPEENPWCGLHLDHGSLTGLTSALYLTQDGVEVPCPDPNAGLYILTRGGNTVKVSIPKDHLAFQLGETAQVHSGGLLRATPHFVQAPAHSETSHNISRETYACFMQPRWDEPMDIPSERKPEDVGTRFWEEGHTFVGFTKALLSRYYQHSETTTK